MLVDPLEKIEKTLTTKLNQNPHFREIQIKTLDFSEPISKPISNLQLNGEFMPELAKPLKVTNFGPD